MSSIDLAVDTVKSINELCKVRDASGARFLRSSLEGTDFFWLDWAHDFVKVSHLSQDYHAFFFPLKKSCLLYTSPSPRD